MAYTASQVSSINAARAANVAAGISPYAGAGATATNPGGASSASGVGGAVLANGTVSQNGTSAITASSLAPVKAVDLPSALPATPVGTNTAAIMASLGFAPGSNGLYASSTATNATPAPTTTTSPSLESILATELNLKSDNTPPNTTALYNKAYADAGIADKQAKVNQYTNQLNAITAKQNSDLLSVRGADSANGVTEAVYGGQAATINREAAVAALPIAAQLSAAQGDLTTAQNHLDTILKYQVADATAQYNYKSQLIDSVISYATKAEQRQFDAEKTKAANDFTVSRDNASAQKALAEKALLTNPALVSQIYSIDPKAADFNKQLGAIEARITPAAGKLGQMDKLLSPSEVLQYQADYPNAGIKIGDTPSTAQAKINPALNYKGATIDGLTATLQSGGKLTFPNQAALDKFKADNGISSNTTTSTQSVDVAAPVVNEKLMNAVREINNAPNAPISNSGMRDALLNRGFSYQEILDAGIGSKIDSAVNTVSNFFSKLFK